MFTNTTKQILFFLLLWHLGCALIRLHKIQELLDIQAMAHKRLPLLFCERNALLCGNHVAAKHEESQSPRLLVWIPVVPNVDEDGVLPLRSEERKTTTLRTHTFFVGEMAICQPNFGSYAGLVGNLRIIGITGPCGPATAKEREMGFNPHSTREESVCLARRFILCEAQKRKRSSEAGNRTPVVRVTGGNTKPLYYFGSTKPPKLDYMRGEGDFISALSKKARCSRCL